MLHILWNEGNAEGTTDVIPMSWFQKAGRKIGQYHDVLGVRGGRSEARCDISINNKHAHLDYEKYTSFNERNGNFIGVMLIVFTNNRRNEIPDVHWKPKGKNFQKKADNVTVSILDDHADSEINLLAISSKEGRKTLRVHLVSERNRMLITKKKSWAKKNGGLVCEACDFDFSKRYPEIGDDFCEIHHREPVSTGEANTKLEN